MNAALNADVGRITSFWFDQEPRMQRWFSPAPGFDDEIQDHFGALIKKARTVELDSWTEEPKGSLALLILLDQFPRNVFRGTADMFSSDAKAVDVASRSIIRGFDLEVTPAQQLFFYLPFMHGESLTSQVASVSLLEGALKRLDPDSDDSALISNALGFARSHQRPILQFGRFPSRNAALGRQTTEEEEEYLKEYPNGF